MSKEHPKTYYKHVQLSSGNFYTGRSKPAKIYRSEVPGTKEDVINSLVRSIKKRVELFETGLATINLVDGTIVITGKRNQGGVSAEPFYEEHFLERVETYRETYFHPEQTAAGTPDTHLEALAELKKLITPALPLCGK